MAESSSVRERQVVPFAAVTDVDVMPSNDIPSSPSGRRPDGVFPYVQPLHRGAPIAIASDGRAGARHGGPASSPLPAGLCVDISPDLETRIAILQLRAQRESVHVPDDVIEFIASRFDQNIRSFEGALVRVVAWSDLTGHPISPDLAGRPRGPPPQTEAEIRHAHPGGNGSVLRLGGR